MALKPSAEASLESDGLLAVLAQRFSPRPPAGYEARWEMRGVLTLAGGLPASLQVRDCTSEAGDGGGARWPDG